MFRGGLSMKDKEKMPRMIKALNISKYPILFLQVVKVFPLTGVEGEDSETSILPASVI